MCYLALASLLFLAVLLQTSVAPHFSVMDVKPDFILILVVIWGVLRGLREALVGAVIGGILLDILGAAPPGVSTIALLPIAFIAGQSHVIFVEYRFLGTLALVFLATFMYDSIFLGALQSLGWETDWPTTFTKVFLPAAVLNGIVSPVPFWALNRSGTSPT